MMDGGDGGERGPAGHYRKAVQAHTETSDSNTLKDKSRNRNDTNMCVKRPVCFCCRFVEYRVRWRGPTKHVMRKVNPLL